MTIKVSPQQIDLRELVNSKLSEFDVYKYYVGEEFRLNTVTKSPFHKDTHPSFSIGASTSGRLIWRDYSADEKGGHVDLVQRIYGLTYPQALQKICKDFGLLIEDGQQYQKIIGSYQQPVIEKQDTIIHVKAGKWTKKTLNYWSEYGIGQQQLQQEEIYVVDQWYLNRKVQQINDGELCYCYRFDGDLFKIYYPNRTRHEGKWKTNVACSTVEALDKLNGSSKVLVAKSRKDRVVLQSVVPYTVLSVQNEGASAWNDEFRNRLEGKEVIIMYDADESGVRNCKKLCDMYNYRYVNTPKSLLEHKVKDPSDWYRHEGNSNALKEFLKIKEVI